MSQEERLKVVYLITALVMVVVFVKPPTSQATAGQIESGDIIITEIMANPKAASDTVGEWLEIYNQTENDIDLSGCEFTDNGSNKFIITELTIPAETYLVLGRNNNPEENGGIIPDYTYSGYTLANTEDAIILTCQNREIDRVEYSLVLGFTVPDGASFILKNLTLDNNIGVNWCVSTSIFGLGDKGTPKIANDECAINNSTNNQPPVISNNQPPIAEAGSNKTAIVGQTIRFDGGSSYDPDGDNLKYSWDFGDGQKANGKTVTHIFQTANIYLVTLTVDDGKISQMDSLTVTVTKLTANDFFGKIIISELLPNPTGPDDNEWIELYNQSSTELDLAGLVLLDASDRKYIFSSADFDSLKIPPSGYFLLPRTVSKISLNNTPPETIKITLSDDEIINEVTYLESALEGWSYMYQNGKYFWSQTPTPGTTNLLTQTIASDKKTALSEDDEENFINPLSAEENCLPAKTNQLILSELLPSPQGDDRLLEFIEIKNISSSPANLCGWSISDQARQYFFQADAVISPYNFFILESAESKISLNNSGDQISLYDANDKLADFIAFGQAKVDWSWSRLSDHTWQWTKSITPGEENMFNGSDPEKMSSTAAANDDQSGYQFVPLENIHQTENNDRIITTGIVTAIPGKLGGQIMYVMNLGGLQIYQHFKKWPGVSLGDRVEVRGIMSFPSGLPRLKLQTSEDLVVLEKNQWKQLVIPVITTDEVVDELVGSLVTIVATAVEVKKSTITLADEQGEINLVVKPSTEIKLPQIKNGDILEATGILDKTTAGYRLLPRQNDDVKIISIQGFSTLTETNDFDNKTIPSRSNQLVNYLYITFFGLIILVSKLIYKIKKRQYGYKQTSHQTN